MALFEIVTMTDDSGMSRVVTDDLAAWVDDMGTEIIGTETRASLRTELQGQPKCSVAHSSAFFVRQPASRV
ncbi:hypothetical protein ACIPCF_19060 (plasmid) [Paracoccus marcusii]|uniref:hypothetical protein n=1 Tax=Paracoccus marcusii TaxID=59779 RepID=UPI0038B9916B